MLWPTAGGLLHGQAVEVEVCAGAAAAGVVGRRRQGGMRSSSSSIVSSTASRYPAGPVRPSMGARTWRRMGCGALSWDLWPRNGDAIFVWRDCCGGRGTQLGGRAKAGVRKAGSVWTAGQGVGNTDVGGVGGRGEEEERSAA